MGPVEYSLLLSLLVLTLVSILVYTGPRVIKFIVSILVLLSAICFATIVVLYSVYRKIADYFNQIIGE